MPRTAVQSNQPSGNRPPSQPGSENGVPPWLAARRERQVSAAPVSFQPADPSTEEPSAEEIEFEPTARIKRPTLLQRLVNVTTKKVEAAEQQSWWEKWVSRQGMTGFLISLSVHGVVLLTLAFIVMSRTVAPDIVSLWGGVGDVTEVGGDLSFDSEMEVEGGESGPLQSIDIGKALDSLGNGGLAAESLSIGLGGNGHGMGESGSGVGAGVGHLKMPGHAQTKGSFSAWAEPREPKPGEDYYIIVHIRLPAGTTKYKPTDLSGSVIGTDGYEQKIRYKLTDKFPVEDGIVEIRIQVPGGARLIRDTVRVESKLLHEKQTFEIVFGKHMMPDRDR